MEEGIEGTFKELGENVRDSMPKIKIGGNIKPLNDPLVDKFKRWLLIGLSGLVAGMALILIISKVLSNFF